MEKIEILYLSVSVISILISSSISFLVSRFTANKEVEKLKLSWTREDSVFSDNAFADMISSISKYTINPQMAKRIVACEKLSAVRSNANGEIAITLDELYKCIYNSTNSTDFSDINLLIDKAIELKRKIRNAS